MGKATQDGGDDRLRFVRHEEEGESQREKRNIIYQTIRVLDFLDYWKWDASWLQWIRLRVKRVREREREGRTENRKRLKRGESYWFRREKRIERRKKDQSTGEFRFCSESISPPICRCSQRRCIYLYTYVESLYNVYNTRVRSTWSYTQRPPDQHTHKEELHNRRTQCGRPPALADPPSVCLSICRSQRWPMHNSTRRNYSESIAFLIH